MWSAAVGAMIHPHRVQEGVVYQDADLLVTAVAVDPHGMR